jgi:hypothetical protein
MENKDGQIIPMLGIREAPSRERRGNMDANTIRFFQSMKYQCISCGNIYTMAQGVLWTYNSHGNIVAQCLECLNRRR